MMNLWIDVDRYENTLIARLKGELDSNTAVFLRRELEQQLSDWNIQHLVLNFQDLTFMDSTGLGVILGRYKQVKQRDGELVICATSTTIDKMLRLSGMYKIIPIKSNEEEALQVVGVM